MTDVRAAAASLLEEKPSTEPALRELLDVDERGPWTFQDVSVDSGTFGEIVSTGIVHREGESYRLRDREALRAALNGDASTDSPADADVGRDDYVAGVVDRIRTTVDRDAAILLAGALMAVVLLRALSFPAVFRNGDVVLLGNDPYYYRYLVEQAVADGGAFDVGALAALPEVVKTGEPLLVGALWFASSLLGGTAGAVGMVLAWYPVVAAVLVGILVYLTANAASNDRRVGLAAVLMLALIPVHAYRSGLGFADHHAFDYVWLALTAYALVMLVVESKRKWLYSALLGLGVAGQILAWDNGPLLVVPVAITVPLYTAALVRRDRSPLREGIPVVGGLALASALVWLAHATLGWQTTVVASVPVLLLIGSVVAFGLGEAARQTGVPARAVLGAEAVGGVVLLALLPTMLPELSKGLTRGVDRLFGRRDIVETTSLVSREMGTILGPFLLLGFVFALGLPYLCWATVRAVRARDVQWLVLSVYAWWFFALALVQLRFAGEFAVVLAVFAGIGFVHLARVVGLVGEFTAFDDSDGAGRPRTEFGALDGGSSPASSANSKVELAMPSRRETATYVGMVAFLGSLSFVQVPVKVSQLTVDRKKYRAAVWMRDYADAHGWSYPQSYVFSSWGMNRMYNYFVNGESMSYSFAQRHFGEFLRSTKPESWYGRLKDRVGFVVLDLNASKRDVASQLSNFGSETKELQALSHYRAVYRDGSIRVFTLVPGATLVGTSEGDSVTASTKVDIEGATFTYENSVKPNADGQFSVTVPYPGEYRVGENVYSVSEQAVTEGRKIRK